MPKERKHIGLFFGSFNPVHVGHLSLANYIIENTLLNEIWFVVSPQNPFKESRHLIDPAHRVNMLELSIQGYSAFKVCDIELKLSTPSYSYKTLQELERLYPSDNFTIIMGSDNLLTLDRWKNIEEILARYQIMVYPRPGYKMDKNQYLKQVVTVNAPVFDIDSTTIREGLKKGKDYRFLIPGQAYQYIKEKKLYN
jgi:nicotinate-nucleotide adenylyltransferase